MTKREMQHAIQQILTDNADNPYPMVRSICEQLQALLPRSKKRVSAEVAAGARDMLAYLNQRTHSQYKSYGLIRDRLADGATVWDCKAVIDYLYETWPQELIDNHLNHTTPFKPSYFDRYLAAARKQQQREHAGRNGALGGLVL